MYLSALVDGESHLWRQRFPSGAPEALASGSATEEEGVAIAPDGASLITSLGRRQSSVWLHDSRGERLLSAEGFAFDPSLSADGARVYYLLRRTSTPGTVELTMVDVASGRTDRLLPDFWVLDYDISRDERHVVFTTSEQRRRAPNLDGVARSQLSPSSDGQERRMSPRLPAPGASSFDARRGT